MHNIPSSMDFAKSQLTKFGWKEGKGLGKNEDGIAEPLKSTLKLDTMGLGYNEYDQAWWQTTYNKAINNIKPLLHYDHNSGGPQCQINNNEHLHRNAITPMTDDEELFKACDGRTAHKAARHSHFKLNGKLERIEMQDALLLAASTSGVSQSKASPIRGYTPSLHKNTDTELDMEEYKIEKVKEMHVSQCISKNNFKLSRTSIKKYERKTKQLMNRLNTWCAINQIKNENKESKCNSLEYKIYSTGNKNKQTAISCLLKDNLQDEANNAFCNIVSLSDIQESVKIKEIQERNKLARLKICDNYSKIEAELVTRNNIVNIDLTEEQKKEMKKDEHPIIVIDTAITQFKNTHHSGIAQEHFFQKMNKFVKEKTNNDSGKKTLVHMKVKHTLQKKKEQQLHDTKKKLAMLNATVEKLVNKANERRLDDIVKDLMAINLTENVSEKIKNKPTQTHLTPV